MLRYETGEEVKPGDRARTFSGQSAIVLMVFEPGSQVGLDYSCPDGGILYLTEETGIVAEPSRNAAEWELVFVERGAVPEGW